MNHEFHQLNRCAGAGGHFPHAGAEHNDKPYGGDK